jgi:chromosomal replication initiation ATPase DnaA
MLKHHLEITNCPHCKKRLRKPGSSEDPPTQVDRIILACCLHFNITRQDIFSRSRKCHVNAARQIAQYLIYERSTRSSTEIGRIFGRDHTSVLNSLNRCRDAVYTQMDIYPHIETIQAMLQPTLSIAV